MRIVDVSAPCLSRHAHPSPDMRWHDSVSDNFVSLCVSTTARFHSRKCFICNAYNKDALTAETRRTPLWKGLPSISSECANLALAWCFSCHLPDQDPLHLQCSVASAEVNRNTAAFYPCRTGPPLARVRLTFLLCPRWREEPAIIQITPYQYPRFFPTLSPAMNSKKKTCRPSSPQSHAKWSPSSRRCGPNPTAQSPSDSWFTADQFEKHFPCGLFIFALPFQFKSWSVHESSPQSLVCSLYLDTVVFPGEIRFWNIPRGLDVDYLTLRNLDQPWMSKSHHLPPHRPDVTLCWLDLCITCSSFSINPCVVSVKLFSAFMALE